MGAALAWPRAFLMARIPHGRLTKIVATVVVGTVIVGGSSLIPNGTTPVVPPPTGTGNLWVIASNTPDGTCTRASSPETLAAAEAAGRQCNPNDNTGQGVFMAAYTAAATSNDTVCVDSGSYGAQQVTFVSGKTTPNTVIQGCGATQPVVLNVIVGNCNGSNQTRAVTFKDMEITGSSSSRAVFVCYGSSDPTTRATDITFDNVDIAVGKATNGPVFEDIGGTLRLTIKNSTIGPACCGLAANGTTEGSPVGIRIGTANRVSGGWPTNTDTVIDNNTIQGITRTCTQWLSGYGSCPQSPCPNVTDQCHADAIQVYGATNLRITNNRIYHNQVNGIFLDSTDPQVGGLIQNNMIGDVMVDPASGSGETCFDIDGRGIYGTWNIINNTCESAASADVYNVTWASVMQSNGAVWNWKGNAGAIKVYADTTIGPTCLGGTSGVFTFSYNTWSTSSGGSSGCGGNETVGTPTYVNNALAPANTMDLHLAGAETGAADNKIPTATCFVTNDIDGDSRPLDSACDAGADER